jgi:HK97 family phage major capsid protein
MGRPRRYCTEACKQAAYRDRKSADLGGESVEEFVRRSQRENPGPGVSSWGGLDTPADVEFVRTAAEVKNVASPYRGAATSSALADYLRIGAQSKALVADATGSIILPTDIAVDVNTVARSVGTIRSLASVRPTNRIKHRAGLLSAAAAGWGRLETGTAVTDAAMSVSSPALDIDVHDVLALALIGQDELDDAPEAARAAITEAIGIAIGEAEDAAFAAGSGSGQPKGLALAANVARVPAGQKTAAAASATPVLADILGLPWKLPTRYRRQAVWLFSEDMAPKIAALTYATGSGIMPNAGQGIGPLGWPYFTVPGLPSAVTAGTTDPSVWFLDVASAYRVAARGPITVQRLTQRYIDSGNIGVLVKRRVGGDFVRPDAAAIYTL